MSKWQLSNKRKRKRKKAAAWSLSSGGFSWNKRTRSARWNLTTVRLLDTHNANARTTLAESRFQVASVVFARLFASFFFFFFIGYYHRPPQRNICLRGTKFTKQPNNTAVRMFAACRDVSVKIGNVSSAAQRELTLNWTHSSAWRKHDSTSAPRIDRNTVPRLPDV